MNTKSKQLWVSAMKACTQNKADVAPARAGRPNETPEETRLRLETGKRLLARTPAQCGQHTPGPWYVMADPAWAGKHPMHDCRYVTTDLDVYCTEDIEGEKGWHFENSDASIICTMPDAEKQCANARLIAAAPELLEALKILVQSPEIRQEDMQQARAAIAKAERGIA